MKRLGLVVVVAALGAAGCADQSRIDAKDVDLSKVDRSAPQVISFSNHYPDVETKCDGHGHRIFVGTHDSAVGQNILVIADPTCPGFVQGQEPGVPARGAG